MGPDMSQRWLLLLDLLSGDAAQTGDLCEEASEHSRWWMARQCAGLLCYACWRNLRRHALEDLASAALWLALPVVLSLELRRLSLTMVPLRAESGLSLAGLAWLGALVCCLVCLRAALLQRVALPVAVSALMAAGWSQHWTLAVWSVVMGATVVGALLFIKSAPGKARSIWRG
jgi:hypothetical protein